MTRLIAILMLIIAIAVLAKYSASQESKFLVKHSITNRH
jgi:hypothetical protein